MAVYVHGKGSVLRIGDATQVLYDLSPITTQADVPQTVSVADTTHYGDQAKECIVGITDSTLSVSGLFDATIDGKIAAAMAALSAGTISNLPVEWSPAGNVASSGNPKYTFNVIITNYTVSSPIGGAVTIKLDAQRTGATTRGTW